MNKIVILFLSLLVAFCSAWVFKSKTPLNIQTDAATEISNNWWSTDEEIDYLNNEVSDEWMLDPEIPENYVPVLGEDELYMVINDDGTIEKYRHRTQQEDGSWVWEDVNPDIPDNYVAVEGLEDVYMVTDDEGNIKYYKYIRNSDNTFTFVEVDENGNIIDDYIVACEEEGEENNVVPQNYVKVDGSVYAVKNEDGVTVEYKELTEEEDGTLSWSDTDEPSSITESHTPTTSYTVSNGNGTSNSGNSGSSGSSSTSGTNGNSNSGSSGTTSSNSGSGSSNSNSSGSYNSSTDSSTDNGTSSSITIEIITPNTSTSTESSSGFSTSGGYTSPVTESEQHYHTQSETYQEVKTVGNYKITYEYTVTYTYDDDGNLISTDKEGPTVVSKESIITSDTTAPDTNLIESTLDNEITRVTNGMDNRSSIASDVVSALNAERTSQSIATLANSSSSDAQKLATLFAADMATYDNTDYESPTYGTIDDLISRYNITEQGSSINVWRTTNGDASKIHSRFQTIDSCRTARMSTSFNQVGVGVFYKNGYYYVAEVLLYQ